MIILHKNKVIIPIRALLLFKICDYIVKDKWVQEKTNCPYIKNSLEQLSLIITHYLDKLY